MRTNTAGPTHEGLFSFRIEFSIRCPRCDGHIPLDGPMEEVCCPQCRSSIDIPGDYWLDTLGSSCRKMQDMEMGGGRGSILMGTFRGDLELARFDPYCDSCKTGIEDPWHLEPGTNYRCRKCGEEHFIEAPPEWLIRGVPRIKLLVDALMSAEEPSREEVPELVSLSCPSCSASLDVNGESRMIGCGYCGDDVYLPDSVWRKFHPGRRKRRWFIVCEYTDEDPEA